MDRKIESVDKVIFFCFTGKQDRRNLCFSRFLLCSPLSYIHRVIISTAPPSAVKSSAQHSNILDFPSYYTWMVRDGTVFVIDFPQLLIYGFGWSTAASHTHTHTVEIIQLSLLSVTLTGGLESIPADIGWKVESSQDRSPGHYRTTYQKPAITVIITWAHDSFCVLIQNMNPAT